MVVVDASVWVSRLFAGDPFHAVSRRWVEESVRHGQVLTSPLILLPEVSGALARRTGKSEIGQRAMHTLLQLTALRLVPLHASLIRQTTDLAANLLLRGADALYVAVAWQLGVPLVTWDQEQLHRAKDLIPVWTPAEALNSLTRRPPSSAA